MSIIRNIIFPKQTGEYKNMTINILLKLFFISILLTIVTNYIVSFFIVTPPTIKTLTNDLNYFQIILVAVILSPIIEEISFRLWLKKGKYNFQLGLIGALIILIASIQKILSNNIFILPEILTSTILITSILFSKFKPIFFQKYYRYFTYTSFITFGFLHIGNYPDLETIHYSLYPIMALPYISLGALLGYTRISYDIRASIILHASINIVPVLLM